MSRPKSSSNRPRAAGCNTTAAPVGDDRRINDELAATFPVHRSESEWLMTLLGAEEQRYIFEGQQYDKLSD